ncbi:MAG: rhomboid family intramembrane serine protease [Anaerolineae bacterium]|nr:rhomboid family intramembrane serine protease [Anaerolineae bacterium]
MTEVEVLPPEASQEQHPQERRSPVPLARPIVTYVLLGIITLVFVIEVALGGLASTRILVPMGAQINLLVSQGEHWRLFTAMFLHIGVTHFLFNAWALYSLGRDIESFYGSLRFIVIYVLSGLFGGLAYYLLGAPQTAVVISAGASGAIFGIIGAELAFWLRNRLLFGDFGKQRLMNLGILVGINVVFGFSTPGINNMAHMGGLAAGFVLALVLTPRYEVTWTWGESGQTPRLADRNPVWPQVAIVIAAVALLIAGLSWGEQRWAAIEPFLR